MSRRLEFFSFFLIHLCSVSAFGAGRSEVTHLLTGLHCEVSRHVGRVGATELAPAVVDGLGIIRADLPHSRSNVSVSIGHHAWAVGHDDQYFVEMVAREKRRLLPDRVCRAGTLWPKIAGMYILLQCGEKASYVFQCGDGVASRKRVASRTKNRAKLGHPGNLDLSWEPGPSEFEDVL